MHRVARGRRGSASFAKCLIIVLCGLFFFALQPLTASPHVAVAARQQSGPPTLQLTPPAVSPGARVLISATGFFPRELVLIRLDGAFEGTTTADAYGNVGGLALSIPAGLALGSHTITLTGAVSNLTASAGFTVQAAQPAVQARIVVIPSAALPGSVIVVAGAGFQPGEGIMLRLNGVAVRQVIADGTGAFTDGSFMLSPTAPAGTYTVSAFGLASGRNATASLRVVAPAPVAAPRLSLSPGSVSPGGRVAISGTGFAPGALVVVRLDAAIVQYAQPDARGAFVAIIQAPGAVGAFTISATQAGGASATATLHVVHPVIVGIGLIPSRAHRGATVLVNGDNFAPGEIVLIRFRGQIVQAAQADSLGRIMRAGFVVPRSAPYGVSVVSITGARSGRAASAPLTIVPAPAPAPHIAVSPSTVHRGGTLTIAGSGYAAGETVLIRLGGALVQAVTANRSGAFSNVRVGVPANAPYGLLVVSGFGARSGRTASGVVHVVPAPGIAISVTPGIVARGGIVYVDGHGFAGHEFVVLRVDGIFAQAVETDAHGAFGWTRFGVPHQLKAGVATILATGGRSGRQARTYLRIVNPGHRPR